MESITSPAKVDKTIHCSSLAIPIEHSRPVANNGEQNHMRVPNNDPIHESVELGNQHHILAMAQRALGSKSISLIDTSQCAQPHETPFKGYLWANRIQKNIQVLLD